MPSVLWNSENLEVGKSEIQEHEKMKVGRMKICQVQNVGRVLISSEEVLIICICHGLSD